MVLTSSGLRITVKLPVSSGRKDSPEGVNSTCAHPREMSRGQFVYLSLMLGEKVRVRRCRFVIVILCGSDGMKTYVIAERERKREKPWNTSTYPVGRRRAPWRQGQNNQKYTRNMQ